MKYCGSTNIPTTDNTAIPCDKFISTDCVIYHPSVLMLNLAEDSSVTEVLGVVTTNLVSNNQRLYILENNLGVSDHGALGGLSDDDHPQYHNSFRADIWLTTKTVSDIPGLQVALDDKVDDSQVLTNVPAGALFTDTQLVQADIETMGFVVGAHFTPTTLFTDYGYVEPTHAVADITGLQVALDDKVDDSQVLTNVPAGALFTDTLSSGLEAINEGNGIGYRLKGVNPDNYGNIGAGAVDFGIYYNNTLQGATGTSAFNVGEDNIISGYFGFGVGYANINAGDYSTAFGGENTIDASQGAFVNGYLNTVTTGGVGYSITSGARNNQGGSYGGVFGLGLINRSLATTIVGQGNTDYTNTNGGLNSPLAPHFVVGNGVALGGSPNDIGTRSDAFIVRHNGSVEAPSLTTEMINSGVDNILVTKGWVQSVGGSVPTLQAVLDVGDTFNSTAENITKYIDFSASGLWGDESDIIIRAEGYGEYSKLSLTAGAVTLTTGNLLSGKDLIMDTVSPTGLARLKNGFITATEIIDPIANTTLNFPAKAEGTYTLATLDDIPTTSVPTLQEVTAEGNTTTLGLEAEGFKFNNLANDGAVEYVQLMTTGTGSDYITSDPFGNIYSTNSSSPQIQKITPEGVISYITLTGVSTPSDIISDGSGNIYVAINSDDTIVKITPEGVVSQFATSYSGTGMLAYDYVNEILYCTTSKYVFKVDSAGNKTDLAYYNTSYYIPYAPVVDSQGNLFIFIGGNYSDLVKFTPAGVQTTEATLAIGASYAVGAIDANDNYYLLDWSTGTIWKVEPNTYNTTVFADNLISPYKMVFDSNGDMYVSDRGSNIITKITPEGVKSSFADVNTTTNGITIRATNKKIVVVSKATDEVIEITATGNNILTLDSVGNIVKEVNTEVDSNGNLITTGTVTANGVLLTGDQDLNGLVPYTGATADVDLGVKKIITRGITSIGTHNIDGYFIFEQTSSVFSFVIRNNGENRVLLGTRSDDTPAIQAEGGDFSIYSTDDNNVILTRAVSADTVADIQALGGSAFITADYLNAEAATIPTLQEVTDVGNTTTLNIDVLSVNGLKLTAQTGVDVNNIGIGVDALASNTGSLTTGVGSGALQNNVSSHVNGVGYRVLYYNTGGYSNGFGTTALYNNIGDFSNGFGSSALYNNTGDNSNGFGSGALQNNTGDFSNGFGSSALYNNTGVSSNGFGHQALQNNDSPYSNGFGANTLQYNLGYSVNGFGYQALQYNIGSYSNGFGYNSLQSNTGDCADGIGQNALRNNTGAYSVGFGYNSLQYNQKDDNTSLGYNANGVFVVDITNEKSFDDNVVDIANDLIVITSHGFGTVGDWVNLKYVQGTAAIGGISNNGIYQFYIQDADTLLSRKLISGTIYHGTNMTSLGGGTGHKLIPQFAYKNTTAIGANSQTTKDNQVVLGDSNVTEVVMGNGDVIYPSNAVKPGDNTEFTGVTSNEIGSLIPSANVLWTGDSSNLIRLILSQDSILTNPSAPIVGAIYQIIVEQDATGLWTLGYDTMFKFPDGIAPVIDLNANSKGILTALYDGTDLLVVSVQNFL